MKPARKSKRGSHTCAKFLGRLERRAQSQGMGWFLRRRRLYSRGIMYLWSLYFKLVSCHRKKKAYRLGGKRDDSNPFANKGAASMSCYLLRFPRSTPERLQRQGKREPQRATLSYLTLGALFSPCTFFFLAAPSRSLSCFLIAIKRAWFLLFMLRLLRTFISNVWFLILSVFETIKVFVTFASIDNGDVKTPPISRSLLAALPPPSSSPNSPSPFS